MMTEAKTVEMTKDKIQQLMADARRIPFTDHMLRAYDKRIKWETRRSVKYDRLGAMAKCIYGKAGTLLLLTGAHVMLDKMGEITEDKSERAEALYRVDFEKHPLSDMVRAEAIEWRVPMFLPAYMANRFAIARSIEPVPLMELTEKQALAEGIVREDIDGHTWDGGETYQCSGREAFEYAWNTIHAERGVYFESNPMVWRIVFDHVKAIEG